METTTTAAPTAAFYTYGEAVDLTAADLRTLADLLDLVGHQVRMVEGLNTTFVGTLTAAYVTDGLAVTVVGENGSFFAGPLYGATVEAH